jgi:hypothetical protein
MRLQFVLCVPCVLSLSAVAQATVGEKKEPEVPFGKKGKTVGVLVKHGDKFIEVRGDGEEKARKYFARFLKGPPPGFDKEMLKTFHDTPVESRLMLEWVSTNHGFMIEKLEVLKAGGKEKKEKSELEGKKGTVTGILTAKDKHGIEVKADGEEKARKYFLHFGGTKQLLHTIHDAPIGSRVRIEWLYVERHRVIEMELLKSAEKK